MEPVFLDISKAFDKMWHEGLLFKLKCNGILMADIRESSLIGKVHLGRK